jgi:hypothetical protein
MNLDIFTHRLNELYQPPSGKLTLVDVPEMKYLMIDGTGDPQGPDFQAAVKWIFSLAHLIKPFIKETLGARFVEPPLECLFWSEEAEVFSTLSKDRWKWRVMIVVLDLVTDDLFQDAAAKAAARLGPAPNSLRLDSYTEGQCVQTLHVGDYSGVSDICRTLYHEFLPAHDLKPGGFYHEIYLNDPNRVAPEKRRIVVRQPVTQAVKVSP